MLADTVTQDNFPHTPPPEQCVAQPLCVKEVFDHGKYLRWETA